MNRLRLAVLALAFWAGHCAFLFAIDANLDGVLTTEKIKPKGEYYEATVPKTLDLAERARISVRGLTNFLNPGQNYAPYNQGWFNVRVPYMTMDGRPNWGKIAEALIMMRTMCGSEENLDIDAKTLKGMVAYAPEDGWTPTARMTLALMALYQRDPDPKYKQIIARLEKSFHKRAKYEGPDEAFYYDAPPEAMYYLGTHAFIQGCAIRMLSRWYAVSGDKDSLELARKLVNYLRRPKFWVPETEPKAVVSSDHAHFTGHIHSYLACLMGLLWYAEVTNDARLKQFVRDGYEYVRNWGIARIGLFGETCASSDMIYLAIKLSDFGVGDYWEDADCYIRNTLVDRQIIDAEKMHKAVKAPPIFARILYTSRAANAVEPTNPKFPVGPMGQSYDPDWMKDAKSPFEPEWETKDRVVERNVGCFIDDSADPSENPKVRLMWNLCAPGNCNHALYYAWEGITRCDGEGNATVNLLLNRASPWLDIDSYLPYEGKVVIRNKTAKTLAVRIPRWVDKKAATAKVGDRRLDAHWVGNYLLLGRVAPKDQITICFPLVESQEQYTLKWKKSEWWLEATDPGISWKNENPIKYTLYLKGNTLVDLSPRPEKAALPAFERDEYKKSKAPMMKIKRFVADTDIKW